MIIIRNIVQETDDLDLLEKKVKKLVKREDIKMELYRKSIDARKTLKFNFQVLVDLDLSEKEIKKIKGASDYKLEDYKIEINNPVKEVSIVGAGPAGLFCAYILSQNGVKVKVYERGQKIEDRVKTVDEFLNGEKLNLESNIQFGEGGAGTFSDGKLTARTKDKRVREVLSILKNHGGPQQIMYDQKPHIGTELLRNIIISMRKEIEENGGEFYFSNKFQDLEIKDKRIEKIIVNGKDKKSDAYVLALGNSARDTFELLSKKIKMENKQFAVGFRIEHKRQMIDNSQYNGFKKQKNGKKLPAASYNLSYNDKNLDMSAYTFCMCPGGYVIDASSEENRKCVNGMSYHDRSGENSNSALIVTVDENIYGKNLLDGIRFQRQMEEKAYQLGQTNVPVQRLKDFIENRETKEFKTIKPTVRPFYTKANMRDIYPDIINQMIIKAVKDMARRIKGFDDPDAILTGVEVRTSSPVRLLRDEENKAIEIENLYLTGEGSGYSGGIVSSAIDGIKTAEKLLNRK